MRVFVTASDASYCFVVPSVDGSQADVIFLEEGYYYFTHTSLSLINGWLAFGHWIEVNE